MMMMMTCFACHMHVEMRDGVLKHLHTTRDWDWRCTARKGYKPHIDISTLSDQQINDLAFYNPATGVYTMARAA